MTTLKMFMPLPRSSARKISAMVPPTMELPTELDMPWNQRIARMAEKLVVIACGMKRIMVLSIQQSDLRGVWTAKGQGVHYRCDLIYHIPPKLAVSCEPAQEYRMVISLPLH